MDLPAHIQDFIDSAIPKLRSQWAEVRGSAAIVIGTKHLCHILPEIIIPFMLLRYTTQFPAGAQYPNRVGGQ